MATDWKKISTAACSRARRRRWTIARPLDVPAIRRDFPILHQQVHGQAAGLVRQRGNDAEAAKRDRRGVELLCPRQLEHPSRRPYAGRAGDRRLRAGPAEGAEVPGRRRPRKSSSSAARPKGSISSLRPRAKVLQPGDEIVLTTLEHHANIVPWKMELIWRWSFRLSIWQRPRPGLQFFRRRRIIYAYRHHHCQCGHYGREQ